MAHLDRMRAEKLMCEIGIEALILLSPESFSYATGAQAGVATMWRRSGAVAVLVPRDPDLPETASVSDLFARNCSEVSHITDVRESPICVETVNLEAEDETVSASSQVASAWRKSARAEDFYRPAIFDPAICYQHLIDAISQQGITHNNIGFEASAISVSDYQIMSDIFSEIKLIDASRIIDKLKMVKTAQDIVHLRQAVEIAESGIIAVSEAIDIHITKDELTEVWRQAIANHPMSSRLSGSWEYISVGNNPWGGNAAITEGDLIKVDVGCLVQGYTSDSARTFVFGKPDDTKLEIYSALLSGFMAGIELLQPGVPLNEVYHSTLGAIRKCGFSEYIRGHFGHGLGAGLGSEQWPFISADEETKLQPGMVMALECPWYIDGLGGMIIENQFLVTDNGHEMMNTLPLGLEEIIKTTITR